MLSSKSINDVHLYCVMAVFEIRPVRLTMLQCDLFQNQSDKLSDDQFRSWILFFSCVGNSVIENKFSLAIHDSDWLISKTVRPNV